MNIKYAGWIPGLPWQRRKLRKLGVRGRMKYRLAETAYGIGAFEYCEVSWEVLKRLVDEWGLPNPGSFTAMDEHGEQLPRQEQKAWSLGAR
jgi:hypothetical protein